MRIATTPPSVKATRTSPSTDRPVSKRISSRGGRVVFRNADRPAHCGGCGGNFRGIIECLLLTIVAGRGGTNRLGRCNYNVLTFCRSVGPASFSNLSHLSHLRF